ncbi:hypothetical protein [Enterococcus sp. AZ109]|uniref:hypothetical protein n=1 Tax=Enterococcus sp. AZ109 TaxID=2774634 RepID=UPI003F266869
MSTETFVQTILKLSKLPDESYEGYLLKQDNLYRRIPEEAKAELLRNAVACGKQAAQPLKGKPLTGFLQQAGIQVVYTKETSNKTKNAYTLAEIRLPDRITLNETLIESGQKLIDHEVDLQFLTAQASIADILSAHELFHYLENRDKLYTTEKHIQYKIGPFSKTARIHALSEIAATAFVKEIYGLTFSPLLFNSVLLYNFDTEFSEDFAAQLLKRVG